MNTYYYVNTGHRVGLDQFRRAAAVIEQLQDLDITLLTNDFRIASIAKEYGFKRAVGIDVLRNISNIAIRGDQLIFDSMEASPTILKDMEDFFSTLIRFSDAPQEDEPHVIYTSKENFAVATTFEEPTQKDGSTLLFFGDDDYEEDLLKLLQTSELKEVDLLLGFYYFLDYETKLKAHVRSIMDEEAYAPSIKKASLLITSSYQAALEATMAQTPVVYMQRVDYNPYYAQILSDAGIKVIPMQAITQADISVWKNELKVAPIHNNVTKISQLIRNSLI